VVEASRASTEALSGAHACTFVLYCITKDRIQDPQEMGTSPLAKVLSPNRSHIVAHTHLANMNATGTQVGSMCLPGWPYL
jgi:hypothetical protein